MGKQILICDDAAFMRMMLKDILVKEGYEVVGEAVNGADGAVENRGPSTSQVHAVLERMIAALNQAACNQAET